MKKFSISLLCFLFVFVFCTGILSPLKEILLMDGNFLATEQDIASANENERFGQFISTRLVEKESPVGGEKSKRGEVVFKLFGFIPIRKVDVTVANDEEYYIGGVPVGLDISTDGAIVISGEALKEGDIITAINGQHVDNLTEIEELLQQNGQSGQDVEVEFLRKNRKLKSLLKAQPDETGKLRLGLWVKDDVTGVGTLTFVNKKNLRFGALGHPIVEANGGNIVPVLNGKVYGCNLIGINKGKKHEPGQLRCVMLSGSDSKGEIDDNNKFGIKGTLSDLSLVDENLTAKLGGRLGVKMGPAKIVSSISGIREEYDIEIIKASCQKSADDKSMVFRVKDKRLLNLTGGIVQGMSGSPIMQDGKIVGAVTHVFLSDPTKGFGVYADWMCEEDC